MAGQSVWTNVSNETVKFEPKYGLTHVIITSMILGAMTLCTIIGNMFVVAAIILEKNLQNVSNYLILSLAVADLMVATLVMPLSAVKEVSQRWWLGVELCDIWVCFDVLCCTASILHLVIIAIDRYWAITDVTYIHKRSANRILTMIAAVWTLSIMISIPARFYVSRRQQWFTVNISGICAINEEKGYTIFSTVGAFYLPMAFITCIYFLIYRTARNRIRKKAFLERKETGATHNMMLKKLVHQQMRQQMHTARGNNFTHCRNKPQQTQEEKCVDGNGDLAGAHSLEHSSVHKIEEVASEKEQLLLKELKTDSNSAGKEQCEDIHETSSPITKVSNHKLTDKSTPITTTGATTRNSYTKGQSITDEDIKRVAQQRAIQAANNREKLEQKRERKAARTLAIITGCFLLCWLPFFLNALIAPFMPKGYEPPDLLLSCFLWLGYLNSSLNPLLYTIFAPDFRNAFSKILFGRYYRQKRKRKK